MKINVKHCVVVKAGPVERNLLPADGPHEVDDAKASELIEAKLATAVEEPRQIQKPEIKPEGKPKGGK